LGKLYLNQRVGKFEILNPNEFEKEYIYWIARGVEGIVKNLAWGAAIPNVSPKQIEELNFPIPSKDIQKNIIRFLNDLRNGNVTDDIYFDEKIENEIKDIQEKQVKLGKVQDELSHQLTQLENLNQAILQEAVQGKLVPQDPKDEPASELLKRIKAEKATLRQAQGKGKKEKPLPPIKPEEIPFEIPENWVWCRLGEVIQLISGQDLKPSEYNAKNIGIPYITGASHFNDGILEISRWTPFPKSKSNLGDLLITCKGTIGAMAFNEIGEIHIARQIMAIRNSYGIDISFVKYFLSQHIERLLELSKSLIPGISRDNILSIKFPLPPLSEQKRIVAEIEKQFALTKQLKEHIIANQQATEQLLKALLHQAFEVEEMVIAKPKGKVIELKPTNVDYYRRM
jgi:type I restriction enzyme S subunit